jgi:hypothetical protein
VRLQTWTGPLNFLLLTLLVPVSADADVLTLNPADQVVRMNEENGATEVLFRFDVSGMRQGSGRRIESAFLEGVIAGVPSDRRSTYNAYPVSSEWSSVSVASGAEPTLSATEVAVWEIEPLDYQRNGGGFVRFDIRDLVDSWSKGTAPQHGVAISTLDVPASALAGHLSALRLVIRYGFITWDE